MRIVHLFEACINPYDDPGWQLWDGDDLIGVYNTRQGARNASKSLKHARAAFLKNQQPGRGKLRHGEGVYLTRW